MTKDYSVEEHGEKGRLRYGSPIFYELLKKMAQIHDKKSHDYASNDNPYGNYHFAGMLSQLFTNSDDAGFVGRIGDKLYRLANLENSGKIPINESIEYTEEDICVNVALWIASRRNNRNKKLENIKKIREQMNTDDWTSLNYGAAKEGQTQKVELDKG